MLRNIRYAAKEIFSVITEKIFLVQTTIILSIVYIFVLGPIAILGKIVGRNFFKQSKIKNSFWQNKNLPTPSLEQARKLY